MCDNGFIVFKSILFRTHSDASQRRSDRPRGVATRQGGGSIEPIEPPLVTGLFHFKRMLNSAFITCLAELV